MPWKSSFFEKKLCSGGSTIAISGLSTPAAPPIAALANKDIQQNQRMTRIHLKSDECPSALAKELVDRLSQSIPGYVKRPFLDFISKLGRNAQRVVNGRVQIFNHDAVL